MAADFHIIRRVGEDHLHPVALEQALAGASVAGITVAANTIDITVSAEALVAAIRSSAGHFGSLDADRHSKPSSEDEETITPSVPATLKRVGMEMRHLVDAPEDRRARKPDRSLVRLLARARIFREAITASDGCSIAELAETHGCGEPLRPAAGSVDTELRCFMRLEAADAEKAVWT